MGPGGRRALGLPSSPLPLPVAGARPVQTAVAGPGQMPTPSGRVADGRRADAMLPSVGLAMPGVDRRGRAHGTPPAAASDADGLETCSSEAGDPRDLCSLVATE